MYPFIRFAFHAFRARRQPRLPFDGVHVSHHLCWPWDLDGWLELNNGRTLTVYDLGRIPFGIRAGLFDAMARERWGLTIAGSVARYRKRVRIFDRLVMKSRLIGWDARFMYIEQAMFRPDGSCTSHAVFRSALTDNNGIVTTDRALVALGQPGAVSPALPEWVAQWIAAEDARPWPPMQDT